MMRIAINMPDGFVVDVATSGKYSPDVMHDLKNRASEILTHAASVQIALAQQLDEPTT